MINQSILWIEFALDLSFESALPYCYPSLIYSDSFYQLQIYLDFFRFQFLDFSFDLYLLRF